ncbi:MAG: hypothetical protein AB1521_16795 [Bacteroidota bacterium]
MNDEKIIPAIKLEQIPAQNKEVQMEGISLPEKPGIGFGIEETKDVVVFGISLANSIIKAFRDGNITLIDIPLFIAPITRLPSALSGINMVPFEIGDIEKFELQQLTTFVKENLDVDEREAKNIIELSLLMIYDIYDLIKAIKQL